MVIKQMKKCEICHDQIENPKVNQRYCKICGKDSRAARLKYRKAEYINRLNGGDYLKLKEVTCFECGNKIITLYNRSFCCYECFRLNNLKNVKCKNCGEHLINTTVEVGSKYCCDNCREEYRINKAKQNGTYIDCKYCGKKFISRNSKNETCSRECYNNLNRENKQIENKVEKSMIVKQCLHCGNKIETVNKIQKYCNKQCRVSAEINRREVRKAPSNNKSNKQIANIKKCKQCGKEYSTTNDRSIFCGKKCRYTHHNKRYRELKRLNTNGVMDVNICINCRTVQRDCIRFNSGFTELPIGAKIKNIAGKDLIVYCPKFQ